MNTKSGSANPLTEKQQVFCIEYLRNGYNGKQAAIKAGYSKDTAASIASENLRKPEIRENISRLLANLEETCQINRIKVIEEHKKIAFSSIAHFHNSWIDLKKFEGLTDEQKECIESIETETREYKGVTSTMVKIKLFSKQKSLDAISKIMGYDAPIKIQNEGQEERQIHIIIDGKEMDLSRK